MPATRGAPSSFTEALKYAICIFLGISEPDYPTSEITIALNNAGVTKLDTQLVVLTEDDINGLKIPATSSQPERPLPHDT